MALSTDLRVPWAKGASGRLVRPTWPDAERLGPFTCAECCSPVVFRVSFERKRPRRRDKDTTDPDGSECTSRGQHAKRVRVQAHFSHAPQGHGGGGTEKACGSGPHGESDAHALAKALLEAHGMHEQPHNLMWKCTAPSFGGRICGAVSPWIPYGDAVVECSSEVWLADVQRRPDVLVRTHGGLRVALEVHATHAVDVVKARTLDDAGIECIEFEAEHVLEDFRLDQLLRGRKRSGSACARCVLRDKFVARARAAKEAEAKSKADADAAAAKASADAKARAAIVASAAKAKVQADATAAAAAAAAEWDAKRIERVELEQLRVEREEALAAARLLKQREELEKRLEEEREHERKLSRARVCRGRCFSPLRPDGCGNCRMRTCQICGRGFAAFAAVEGRVSQRKPGFFCSFQCASTTWLNVAFSDKERAKPLGARWNGTRKRWFCVGEEAAKTLSLAGFYSPY
jgi:hypothetical protein